MSDELTDFDFSDHKYEPLPRAISSVSIMNVTGTETLFDRKLRMLIPLAQACVGCSMCELGLKPVERSNIQRDPHVLSNLKPSVIMVVGQNPGWNEVVEREPFVGAAGQTFTDELVKHGLSRSQFYVCNIVRCYTTNNSTPNQESIAACEPFLRMEINLLRPKLIVTLGVVAFHSICPGVDYDSVVGSLVKSRFGIHVYPIYHPSPLNLADGYRKEQFIKHMAVMCVLAKKLFSDHDIMRPATLSAPSVERSSS